MNQHTSFYRFVSLDDPESVATRLRTQAACVTGSIIVAAEGINGAVAGSEEDVSGFERFVTTDACLASAFSTIPFKRSAWRTPPFAKLKVSVKPRIVAIDVDNTPLTGAIGTRDALSPHAWREAIMRDDVVVLDNRNHFEFALGRFKQALDPRVSHFKDFPSYVRAHAPAWKREGKTVAMYCTGGIRCERTSAWVQRLGLNVVELDGGILNYFAQMPDADRDWQGECYVFDNRVAVDTHLHETPTTAEAVFANQPDEAWRLARARRLEAAALNIEATD